MTDLTNITAPLGMGCWPIGGAMFHGDTSLGYTGADDAESLRTIHAALEGGITLFDTAAAYGAGHAERLLGKALKDRPEAVIVTKIGIGIDEDTRQLTFGETQPESVAPAVEAARARLGRDKIDVVLLHDNELPVAQATPIFDELDALRDAGQIGSYGWSTDFTDSATAMASRSGFTTVEHAMNLFADAPRMQAAIAAHDLTALIRSPLAMGLLTGKYGANDRMAPDDIRASGQMWLAYFKDARPNPDLLDQLDAVRELLMTGGRSLTQGALAWVWGRSPRNIAIPGARTVAQITELAGALEKGPLPDSIMAEIDTLIPRDADRPDAPR